MHVISVRVEHPQAADLFAYRGWIFVLTFDGRVLAYPTSDIAMNLVSQHSTKGAVASYALFSAKGIGASSETRTAWRDFDHLSNVKLASRPPTPLNLGRYVECDAVLDFLAYYDRLYVATNQGTWSAAIGGNRGQAATLAEPSRLTADATESLSVGMGAVAASLGLNGLAVFLDAWKPHVSRVARIERESLRTSLGWGRATNYPTDSSYEQLQIESREHRGRSVLDTVEAPQGTAVQLSEDAYAVWEAGRLLVADPDGISSYGRATARSRKKPVFRGRTEGRPLWVGVTGNRFVVTEFDNSVQVSRNGTSVTISEGPSASVRTFTGSHRYRRLIAATVEGGFVLAAAFMDETGLG